MKKEIGLWIDQYKAVIVILTMKDEVIQRIESSVDRPDRYYEKIISSIRDAASILIFGPGEAKGELENQLERFGLREHIVDIQTDGEMTDRQISAKVNRYFPNKRRYIIKLEENLANNP